MTIFKISAIPSASLFKDGTKGEGEINKSLSIMLQELQAQSRHTRFALEYVLFSGEEAYSTTGYDCVEAYLALHDGNELLEKIIFEYITAMGFSLEKLSNKETDAFKMLRKGFYTCDSVIVTKTEKMISSAVSSTGYYYYTDIIKSELPQGMANSAQLFNIMKRCPNSMISIQIISVEKPQAMLLSVQQLASALELLQGGGYQYGYGYKEPYADEALLTYSHYSKNAGQALFTYNIYVSSKNGNAKAVAAGFLALLQKTIGKVVDFDVIPFRHHLDLSTANENFPFELNRIIQRKYRNLAIWNSGYVPPVNLAELPYLITSDEAALLLSLPVDNGQTPGIKINMIASDGNAIDESVTNPEILFGRLAQNAGVSIGATKKRFAQHALIVGAPGSGKTTFALNLLMQFYNKGIPFLAIEPTKKEYRALIDKIPELQVFTPGNRSVSPFIINPFIPPRGITREMYVPSLASAFKAAFSMETPLDVIFLAAINKSYNKYGWKRNSKLGDAGVKPFGLYEFILVFKELIEKSNYDSRVRGNIETAGIFRLQNLIEQNADIYDTIHTMPIEDLLSKPTVIELNAIENEEFKALIMALLLISICTYTKNKTIINEGLNNIILVDEAHVLLKGNPASGDKADPKGNTISAIESMIAELRAYGTGIIIADQRPTAVGDGVVANTDIKVAFRLVEDNDRAKITKAVNLSEDANMHLSRLLCGEAFVYSSDTVRPLLINTVDVKKQYKIRQSIPDDEINGRMTYWKGKEVLLCPYAECTLSDACRCGCNYDVAVKGEYYADHILDTFGSKIKTPEVALKYLMKMHELVVFYERDNSDKSEIKRLCNCTKIRFLRNLIMEKELFIPKDIERVLRTILIKEDTFCGDE